MRRQHSCEPTRPPSTPRKPSTANEATPTTVALYRDTAPHAIVNLPNAIPPRTREPTPAQFLVTWPPAPTLTATITPDTGAHTLSYPSACKHCAATLRWPSSRSRPPFTICDNCYLSAYATPRQLPRPSLPTSLTSSTVSGPARLNTTTDNIRPLCVDDYRWASVRQHPTNTDTILVCRYNLPIASLPLRQARYIRAIILASSPPLSVKYRINENDVAAHIIAICITAPPNLWPTAPDSNFRGDQHTFMSWTHLLEPGALRPASLPRTLGPLHFADPSTSAYQSVASYNSPLNANNHDKLLHKHPMRAFLYNNINCGFPLLSEPPVKFRAPRADAFNTPSPALREQELVEINNNCVIEAADAQWLTVPLRFAPWIESRRNGKSRGITDLSFGDNSTNACATRTPLMPSRLASWQAVAGRILYLKSLDPYRPVALAKLDASRAFRQVALAIRDFWKTAQIFSGRRIVHVRLPFGATNSVDLMSQSLSAVQDLAAELFGIFVQSYVDDQIIIDYADTIDQSVNRVRRLWQLLGWLVNAVKFETEGKPATSKDFLGVQINTVNCSVSITPKRLKSLHQLLHDWTSGAITPTPKRLMSLAGTLNFVSTVIPFGKTFLTRLYSAASSADPYISESVAVDLRWWQHALTAFNGTASFAPLSPDTPVVHVSTDAAKSGWGVVSPLTKEWAAGAWTQSEIDNSSTAHWEGGAVVIACDLFGTTAQRGLLVVHSDSIACVNVFNNCRAYDARLLTLLRCAVILQLKHGFRLVLEHIPGVHNVLADHSSRKHCLPPGHDSWTRLRPTRQARLLGGALLSASPTPPSPALCHTAPQSTTSTSTADSTDINRSPSLPWILWNRLHWVNPDMAAFST